MPELNIPFPGLYESWLSRELDREEEMFAENREEEERAEYPDPIALTGADWADLTWRHMSYPIAHEILAKEYLDAFDAWAGEILGETRPAWFYSWADKCKKRTRIDSCGLTFTTMTSPREYNFTTDRLFANASAAFVRRLWSISKADNHDTLRQVIRDRFTSYDGFISHYPNRLDDWPQDIADWDYNQLGTLLLAALQIKGADSDDDSLMWSVLESDAAAKAFSTGMDWESLESAAMELRAERLADWLADDPESASKWRVNNPDKCAAIIAADPSLFQGTEWRDADAVGAFYRCDKTPDLFDQVQP